MEKKSFKSKRFMKENDSSYRDYKEEFATLDEKYSKIKDILKQVLKDLQEEKDKRHQIVKENEKLAAELKDKDELLEQMQSVSEAVIDEYSALKVKCDLETEAANNAIKRATKYFQENQKLRNSNAEPSETQASDSSELQCKVDTEETGSELDVLNKLSSDLRTEVASLKTQLSKEIEKQTSLKEDFEIAKQLYEQEMKEHNCTKEKLNSIQIIFNKHISTVDESNNTEKCVKRSSLPQSKCPENGIEASIDHRVSDPIENLNAVRRLSIAEKQVASFKIEKNTLLKKVQELEGQVKKLQAEVTASESLPIPPPPPPPPLPPPSFNPIKSLITFIHAGKKSSKSAKKESQSTDTDNTQQKAMSEMIDAIKHGKVFLKPTPKSMPQCPEEPKAAQETALGEMKNILATLKKRNCVKEVKGAAMEDSNVNIMQSIEMSTAQYSIPSTDENFNVDSNIDDELRILFRKRSLKSLTSNDETTVDNIPQYVDIDIQENQLDSCNIPFPDAIIKGETKNGDALTKTVDTVTETEIVNSVTETKTLDTITETKTLDTITETKTLDTITETKTHDTITETKTLDTVIENKAVDTVIENKTVGTGTKITDVAVFETKKTDIATIKTESADPTALETKNFYLIALETKCADLADSKDKSVKDDASETKCADLADSEDKSVDDNAFETKNADVEVSKIKHVDVDVPETKDTNIASFEIKSVDIALSDTKHIDIGVSEAINDVTVSETKSIDDSVSETKNTDVDVSETKNTDVDVSETKNTDVDVSETKSTDVDVSETKDTYVCITETRNTDVGVSEIRNTEMGVSEIRNTEMGVSETKNDGIVNSEN